MHRILAQETSDIAAVHRSSQLTTASRKINCSDKHRQPDLQPVAIAPRRSRWARGLALLHPSHAHSVFSATVVLMVSTFLSRIIGLVRVKYIVWLFGSGMQADALNAAFVLPDMISYFLVGGAASITFVTILTRYREAGREAEGERSLSVILTTMYLVLGAAIVLAEIFAPWYVRWWFNGFDPQKAALCVLLTRILLPAQLCFFAGGVFGAVLLVRKQFSVQAVAPLIYGLGTIVGGLLLVKRIGVSSLAIGTVAGAFCGPFLLNWFFARRAGTRYRFILDWRDEGLREWVRLSLPLMAGVSLVTADNWIIAHFASKIGGAVSLMSYAKQLFTAPMAMLAQAAGAASMPFFASLWSRDRHYEFATGVADSVSRVASLGLLAASGMVALGWPAIDLVFTGGRFSAADCAPVRRLLCHLLRLHVSLVGAGHLRARLLCRRKHLCAHGRQHHRHRGFAAHLCVALSLVRSHRAWRSPPTSASPCKPSPSPCCCTSGAWFRSPAWTTRRWAAACSPPLLVARPPGCSRGAFGSLFHYLPGIALLHHARYSRRRHPHRRHRGLDADRKVGS